MPEVRFADRSAIVTGSGSGIGFEIARKLHAEGPWVLAADVDTSSVPDGCEPIRVDVAPEPDVVAMIARAVDARGRLDLLCNNPALHRSPTWWTALQRSGTGSSPSMPVGYSSVVITV